MKPLRRAIDDYITLRRSLGFKLRRYGRGSSGLCHVPGAEGSAVRNHRTGYGVGDAAYAIISPAIGRNDSVLSAYSPAIGMLRTRARRFLPWVCSRFGHNAPAPICIRNVEIQKLLAAALKLSPSQGLRPRDIPLPVRAIGRGRVADQRGAQAGAAGCGSRRGHSHHPPNEVRQDPPGSAAHFHSGRHGRLRPAPRPVSAQRIVSLFLSQRSRPPSGRVLRFVEHSTICHGRSACAGRRITRVRGCTIFGTDLPSARWSSGIGPTRISSGACRCCRPSWGTGMWQIPTGTFPWSRN